MSAEVEVALARWRHAADDLVWERPPQRTVEIRGDGRPRWFPGGRLNLAVNAVHRHVPTHVDRVALHWEGEPGDRRDVTYGQLDRDVRAAANALAGLGVGVGDRVAVHVGLLPEAVTTMLACARLGAAYCVLPAVLPADALADRLEDLAAKVLVTQDGAWRHGVVLPLKQRADEALTAVGSVEHTIVVRRTGIPVPWFEGDRWFDELVAEPRPGTTSEDVPPAAVDSDGASLLTYLADRGGRPTGIVHGTGGLAVYAATVHRAVTPTDEVLWAPAELGWMLCQSHGVLGPLVAGGTAVIYEGMLDTPTPGRAWEIVARHRVATLVASPSVMRALRTWAGDAPTREQLASLRHIVTAGEALDEDMRQWLTTSLASHPVEVVNAWGQTELGGVVAVLGSRDRLPAAGLQVEDADGRPTPPGVAGELVLRHPWPATALGVHGTSGADPSVPRFRDGTLLTGDRARVAADGQLELLGRSDRAFSVAGQLVSAAEVKATLEEHPYVDRAEVLDRPDATTGRAVVAIVQARAADDASPQGVPLTGVAAERLAADLRAHVRERLGGLSQPRSVVFVDRLPHAPDDELLPALRALTTSTAVVQHLSGRHVEATLAVSRTAAGDGEPPQAERE